MIKDFSPNMGTKLSAVMSGATTQGRFVYGSTSSSVNYATQPTDWATAKQADFIVQRSILDPDDADTSYETIATGTRVSLIPLKSGKLVQTDQCVHSEVYNRSFGDDLTITITGTITYSGGASRYQSASPKLVGKVYEVSGNIAYAKVTFIMI